MKQKQYKYPKIKIAAFDDEHVLLDGSSDPMSVWQSENNGVVTHADYSKAKKLSE